MSLHGTHNIRRNKSILGKQEGSKIIALSRLHCFVIMEAKIGVEIKIHFNLKRYLRVKYIFAHVSKDTSTKSGVKQIKKFNELNGTEKCGSWHKLLYI